MENREEAVASSRSYVEMLAGVAIWQAAGPALPPGIARVFDRADIVGVVEERVDSCEVGCDGGRLSRAVYEGRDQRIDHRERGIERAVRSSSGGVDRSLCFRS